MGSPLSIAALLCFAGQVLAHEHHTDDIPEGEAVSAEPIVCLPLYGKLLELCLRRQDTILWIHIVIQILSFGIVFPAGMVLGVRLP